MLDYCKRKNNDKTDKNNNELSLIGATIWEYGWKVIT